MGCVSISIKSEIDSRVILYPMMRCLKPLGNILIVTSNKQVPRLVEAQYNGYFKNFHIIFDAEGGSDTIFEENEIDPEEYNYVVYDNVGTVSQDKLIIAIGPIVSEQFEDEMMYYGSDRDTHILRFGKPSKKKSKPSTVKPDSKSMKGMTPEEKKAYREELKLQKKQEQEERKAAKLAEKEDRKNKSSKKSKKNMTEEEMEEAAVKKFKPKKEDIQLKLKKLPNLKFPRFEDIEAFESEKKFTAVDKNFVKFFYTVFQEYIGIKEPFYMKEVSRKDESSSSWEYKPASGENSIIINA